MGMIDEAYPSEICRNGQSSTLVNNIKSQSMISSPAQGQNIQASSENGEESLNRLRYESRRLSTFDKWPASAQVEPRKIAKAGFFYTGQYAEAKCLWCGCVITTWEYGDQVMTRHRSVSPDCPFVRDVSDNIPLLSALAISTHIANSHSEDHHLNLESQNDSVDYGPHHGRNSNSHMASPDSPTETLNAIEDARMVVDETGITVNDMEASSPVGNLAQSNFSNGPHIASSSSRTRTGSQSRSDTISLPQRPASGSGELRHPVSGRRLSEDPTNRPTAVSPDIDDDIYKIEAERLKTYEAWPVSSIRPADLANAGFVYTGRGDCVRCVFCREHVGEWDEDDFPHTEHRLLFPHCPFVRGVDVGNVPLNTEIRDTFASQVTLHPWSQNNQQMQLGASSAGDDFSTDVPLNSSQEQPTTQYTASASRNRLRPSSGQNNTFYRRQHSQQNTRSSNVSNQRPRSTSYDHHPLLDRNFLENSMLRTNVLGGDVVGQGYDEAGIRSRPSGGPEKGILQFMNNGGASKSGGLGGQHNSPGARGSQPESIGIIQHSGPANTKYSTVEARARTFREWPPALTQTPTQLSEAGFFYIGLSDQVKCFYCDGGLRNWQPEDDPWTEHARWFSECGFVRLVKGDDFISKCLNKHPPENIQGVHVISRDRSRTTVREDELQQMMSSPIVHQVLATGIQSAQVKKALRQRLQETGSGFKFAHELVEAALHQYQENNSIPNREENQRVTFGMSNCPTAQNSSQLTSSQSQVPCSESHTSSNNRSQNISTAGLPHPSTSVTACKPQLSENPQCTRTCTSAPGTLESNIPMGCQKHPSAAQRAGHASTKEGSIDLEVENRRLKDQRTCKICMDREIGVVFLPCGHLISCVQCAPALKDCPLCRQPIHGTVKTYMS